MADTESLVTWLRDAMDAAHHGAEAATWCEGAGTWRASVSEFGTPTRSTGPRWYIEDAMDDGVITTVDPQASADEGVARHIARQSPASVLCRITADRALLDDLLAEQHVVTCDPFYSCAAATEERDGGWNPGTGGKNAPCDCGLDDRVLRRVRLIAGGYGWTGEPS